MGVGKIDLTRVDETQLDAKIVSVLKIVYVCGEGRFRGNLSLTGLNKTLEVNTTLH